MRQSQCSLVIFGGISLRLRQQITASLSYTGDILGVRTYDPQENWTTIFTPGDKVELMVYYNTTRHDGWSEQMWAAGIVVFDDVGKELGHDSETFYTAPWTESDTNPKHPWEEPLAVKFTMPNKTFVGIVELYAGYSLAGASVTGIVVDSASFVLMTREEDGELPDGKAKFLAPLIVGGVILGIGIIASAIKGK